MKLVIPDGLQLDKKYLSALQELTEVTVYEDKVSDENEIIKRIGDVEIITVNYFDLTRNIIENASTVIENTDNAYLVDQIVKLVFLNTETSDKKVSKYWLREPFDE